MFGTLKQVLDNKVQECVLVGDCLARLGEIPEGSVHMVVTSPPYWGLRDYMTGKWEGGDPDCKHKPRTEKGLETNNGKSGIEGRKSGKLNESYSSVCGKCGARRVGDAQFGMEEIHDCGMHLTPQSVRDQYGLEPCGRCFVCHMVRLGRLLWPALRDDGSFWLNLGDSYATSGGHAGSEMFDGRIREGRESSRQANKARRPAGLKQKDLCGVPWRTALALQADGWYLRSALPWVGRDSMPESVRDRPGSSLEYVFQFTKSAHYYFDMAAVRRRTITKPMTEEDVRAARERATLDDGKRNFRDSDLWFDTADPTATPWGLVGVGDELVGLDVTSEPLHIPHFAAYPPALIRPLIRASTSQRGVCPACGAPHHRVTEEKREATRPARESKLDGATDGRGGGKEVGNRDPERHVTSVKTVGWEPGCRCGAGEPVPALVLDPFLGAGTSMLVASQLGRRSVGIELSEKYAEMARKRVSRRGKVSRPRAGDSLPEGEGFFSEK